MHSPKHSRNKTPIGSAKNAQRRSARPAHHIDAHSAVCGTRLPTLQASTKTPAGACIACVCRAIPKKHVLFAKANKRKNTSAPQRGWHGSPSEEYVSSAKRKRVVLGSAQHVSNANRSSNFLISVESGLLAKTVHKHAMHVAPFLRKLFSASGLLHRT